MALPPGRFRIVGRRRAPCRYRAEPGAGSRAGLFGLSRPISAGVPLPRLYKYTSICIKLSRPGAWWLDFCRGEIGGSRANLLESIYAPVAQSDRASAF